MFVTVGPIADQCECLSRWDLSQTKVNVCHGGTYSTNVCQGGTYSVIVCQGSTCDAARAFQYNISSVLHRPFPINYDEVTAVHS